MNPISPKKRSGAKKLTSNRSEVVHFLISAQEKKELKFLALEKDMTLTDFIREAIRSYKEKCGKKDSSA